MHEARKVVRNDSDAEDCVAAAYASTFQAMRKGGGPTEAFRPYLLTATRNAALQLVRLKRYGSEVATDVLEPPAHVDLYEIGADPAIRNAFATLPERWREVLWKTEIEGLAPRDLATELAMSANGVAALAKRARDGFRKAYLTEAVGPDPHPWAIERLDLYRDGALDPRTSDLVELHVENCARCQDALVPVPITAASIGVLLLAAGAAAPAAIGASTGGVVGGLFAAKVRHLRPRWMASPAKLATASAAAVAIVGTALVVVISARQDDRRASSSTTTAEAVIIATTAPPAGLGPIAPTVLRPTAGPSTVEPSTVPTAASLTNAEATTILAVDTEDPTTSRRRTTTTRRRLITTAPPAPIVAASPRPSADVDRPVVPTSATTTTAVRADHHAGPADRGADHRGRPRRARRRRATAVRRDAGDEQRPAVHGDRARHGARRPAGRHHDRPAVQQPSGLEREHRRGDELRRAARVDVGRRRRGRSAVVLLAGAAGGRQRRGLVHHLGLRARHGGRHRAAPRRPAGDAVRSFGRVPERRLASAPCCDGTPPCAVAVPRWPPSGRSS